MSDLGDLYQQVILDHNRKPRNFGPLPTATKSAEGHNPLCGDEVTVHVELDDHTIKNVTFEGSGCAISKSSASLMTEAVKGKTTEEVAQLFHHVHAVMTGEGEPDEATLGKLAVFVGVQEYPSRVKCATLAWHTLNAALAGSEEKVTTE